jgi:DNA repair exonuclease SbcCD ATPase subunit
MLHPRVALSSSQRSNSASKRVGAGGHGSDPIRPRSATTGGVYSDPMSANGKSAFSMGGGPATFAQKSPEDALVGNLKQQIQCLELEVKYLKSQPVKSPIGADLPSSTSADRRHQLNATIGSQGGRAANDELLRRADALETEVTELRQQYALREQEHQLELASLRQMIDSDKRSAGSQRSLREELERRDAQIKSDVSSLKSLHAHEVVALQNTVERLKLEKDSAVSDLKYLSAERDEANKEVVSLREVARAHALSIESLHKQLQESMLHLTQEQGLRRASEVREASLKESNDALLVELKKLKDEHEDRDEANRRHEGSLQGRNFEIDQLRLTVERQKDDLARVASEMVETKAKMGQATSKFAELEGKLAKAGQTLTDVQSEREFFRLQCDRLKVENSILEVKAQHLDQSLNAERASLTNMERQLCTALDQAEQLRRDARYKEDVYRTMDDFSSQVRVQLRLVEQDRAELQKKLDEAMETLESLNERYAQVKHLEDQKKLEQQLQQALIELARSKREMQTILAHQQRVADDFTHALIDLPEVSHAARDASMISSKNISPSRSSRHIAAGAVQVHENRYDEVAPNGDAVQPLSAAATLSVEPCEPTDGKLSAEELQRELDEVSKRIADEENRAAALLQK